MTSAAATATVNETHRVLAECKCKAMISDLGSGYRPSTPLSTVGDFQRAWNTLLPSVRGVPGVVLPSQNSGQLTTDGLYGAQTAKAATNFLDPGQASTLPTRAADVPGWWTSTSNREAVMSMCPPAPPVQPVPPTMPLPTQPVVPIISAHVPPSVITAPSYPPPPSPPPPPMAPIPVVTQLPPANIQPVTMPSAPSSPMPVVQQPTGSPAPIVVVRPASPTVQLPPIQLTAKPERGGAVFLAGGIAVVAVAGALIIMGRKRRRR